jgi:hypothetical protein
MIEGDRLLAVPRAQQGSRTTNWEGGFTPQVAPYVGKPIIAYATWKRAQDMLDSTADHVCRRNLRSLPLIGIAKCGICGSPLISHRVRHSGREWMYYRCSSNVGGSRVAGRSTHKDFGIPAEKLWRAVVRKVLDDYLSDEAIASLMHTIETQRRQLAETGRSSLEDLKASITDLEKRRATIKANMVYAAGRDAVIAFSDELTSVAKQLEAAKGELMAAKNLAGESRKGLKDTLASVRKFYVSLRDRIQSTRSAETEDAIRIVVKQVIVGVQQKPPVKKGSKRQRVTIANVEIVVDAQLPDVSPMSLFNRNHKSQWFRLNKLRLVVSGDEFSRA